MTSITTRRRRSTRPVAKSVGWSRLADRKVVSSTPSWATTPTLPGSSTRGSPCSRTAPITVSQQTPSSLAICDTGRPLSPTCRQHSRPARSVRRHRAENQGDSSVQVLAAHGGSSQRQRRLHQVSRAGRPKAARSLYSTLIRSCAVATTPHCGQPTITAVVSTSITTSASVSLTARTRNPSRPSIASAAPVASAIVRSLLVVAALDSRNDDGGSWHPAQPLLTTPAPHSDRKSRTSRRRRRGPTRNARRAVLLCVCCRSFER